MPEPRPLSKAPITEAVIHFAVKARPDLDAGEFTAAKAHLAERFPHAEERRGGRITLQFPLTIERLPALEELGLDGFVFWTADRKLAAQFRTAGFSLNRLPPYTSWEELRPVADDVWRIYAATARPLRVVRVSVRYLNDILLPPDLRELATVLRAAPRIPPELPQQVNGFSMRVALRDEGRQVSAHVRQTLRLDQATQRARLLLDIETFATGEWDASDAGIGETLESLRAFKNEIFFNSVTEELLQTLA